MPTDFRKCVFISYARENKDNQAGDGEPIDQCGVIRFLVENRIDVLVDNPHLFKRAHAAAAAAGGFLHGFEHGWGWEDTIDRALQECPVVLYFISNRYLSKFEAAEDPVSGRFVHAEAGRIVRRELLMARGKQIFLLAETAPDFGRVERGFACDVKLREYYDLIRRKHCPVFDRRTAEGMIAREYRAAAEGLLTDIREALGSGQPSISGGLDQQRLSLLDRERQSDVVIAGRNEAAFAVVHARQESRHDLFLTGLDLRLRRRRAGNGGLGHEVLLHVEEPLQPYFDADPIVRTPEELAAKIWEQATRRHAEARTGSGAGLNPAVGLIVPVTLDLFQRTSEVAAMAARTILNLRALAEQAIPPTGRTTGTEARYPAQFVFLCDETGRRGANPRMAKTSVVEHLAVLLKANPAHGAGTRRIASEVDIILARLGSVSMSDLDGWVTGWTGGEQARRSLIEQAFTRDGVLGLATSWMGNVARPKQLEMAKLADRIGRFAAGRPDLLAGWGTRK